MPEVTFSTRGTNEVGAAYGKIQKAAEAAAKGQGQLNEQLQLTGKEAKALDRLQTEIAKRHETAQERFIRKSEEARRALAGHKNETQLLKKETTALLVEYLRSTDAGRNTATKQREQLEQARAKSRALQTELAKLPPLYDQATTDAREFAFQVDLGRKNAGKTREEILKIRGAGKETFGDKALGALGAYAAGFLSVHKAAQLVTDEMRAQQDLVDKRTAAQMTAGEAVNDLISTLVGSSDEDKQKAVAASEAIARETNVSQKYIAPALGDAISAKGGDVAAAAKATLVAARYRPGRPDTIKDMAGSLLDISKATGTDDAVVNLGLYQQLGQLSRVNDPNQMQQTIPASLVGQASFGSTFQEGGALFAAISNASTDKEGRATRTATVQLAKQLQAFNFSDDPAVQQAWQNMSFTQRVETLQRMPAQAQRFFAAKTAGGFGASFETKPLGAIRDLLLNPNSVAAQEYRKSLAAIPGVEGLRAQGEGALGDFARLNRLEPVAAADRALKFGNEQLLLDQSATGSVSQEQRDQLMQTLLASGYSNTWAKIHMFSRGLGDGGPGMTNASAIDILRDAKAENAGGVNSQRPDGSWTFPLTPEQERKNAIIDKAIADFSQAEEDRKKQIELQERQAKASEDILSELRNSGGLVSGGR